MAEEKKKLKVYCETSFSPRNSWKHMPFLFPKEQMRYILQQLLITRWMCC